MTKKKESLYTAVELNEFQRHEFLTQLFKSFLYPPEGWELKAHHIVINTGKVDRELNPDITVGGSCTATVKDVLHRRNAGLFAVGVNPIRHHLAPHDEGSSREVELESINPHPHITVAYSQGVKPKAVNSYSDEREWQIVPKLIGVEIHGVLKELYSCSSQ